MKNIHDLNRSFLTVAKLLISSQREKALMLLKLTDEQCDAIDKLSYSEVDNMASTNALLFTFSLSPSEIERISSEESAQTRTAIALLSGTEA